jgi:hypothetical protein
MKTRSLLLCLFFCSALTGTLLLEPLPAQEAPGARLTFIKVFRGSQPEYIKIAVEEGGRATYQGGPADDPDEPETLQLSPEFTRHVFALAAQLGNFQGIELETNKRVAHMGEKTFIYEKAGQRSEVRYNYTTNQTAEELRQLFESLARGRILIGEFEQELVFDRLGLMETMRKFEREFNAGHLVELDQFVPVLERIAQNSAVMSLARERAQALLRRIQGAPATLQLEYGDQLSNRYYKMIFVYGGAVTLDARRYDDPPQPKILELPPGVEKRVWELVGLANYFRSLAGYQEPAGRLSGYRITYEYRTEQQQVAFSGPPTAVVGELVRIFEQTINQQEYRSRLKKALEEKSLMLQVILQDLDKAVSRNDLLDPAEFAPLLEGIANEASQHEIVRAQAQRLLARIRQETQ